MHLLCHTNREQNWLDCFCDGEAKWNRGAKAWNTISPPEAGTVITQLNMLQEIMLPRVGTCVHSQAAGAEVWARGLIQCGEELL